MIAHAQQWTAYNQKLSKIHKDEAQMLWNSIVCEVPDVRMPETEISADGKLFSFVWGDDINFLEVNISLDTHQEIGWFYFNGMTCEMTGSIEPDSHLTKELIYTLAFAAVEPATN